MAEVWKIDKTKSFVKVAFLIVVTQAKTRRGRGAYKVKIEMTHFVYFRNLF